MMLRLVAAARRTELRMLRDTVACFVEQERMPLQREVIQREVERGLIAALLIAPDA